jgi:TPR repeat protein
MSANAGSRNSSNQSLTKLAIAARVLGKELRRLKLKRMDLARADLRLGEKAYATGMADGQAELVSKLDGVAQRVTQLRQHEAEAASTFGEKVRALANRIARAVQVGALELKRRRLLRRLGASLRQGGTKSSLAEEARSASAVADRITATEAAITGLRPQTYLWARRPLLIISLLLLLLAIGGAFALRHQSTAALAQKKRPDGLSLSDAQAKSMLTQQQTFQQQMQQMVAEAHRRETEQRQARIAAAERQYREQRDRERAEVEKRQREEATERDRIAAERARQEEKKREEERRIAAEKAKQEQQRREAEAQRANERQKAAAVVEHATKQNAEEQLAKVRTAADAGDANAMVNLGNAYSKGEGVAKDLSEAVRWYRKAAEAGHSEAMVNLGYRYGSGEGVEKDLAEELRWYRKAAEAGNAMAMFNLAVVYHNGEGVEKDLNESARWCRKAAEAGHLEAMFNLAAAYATGEGVPKNAEQAVGWYRKAAGAGHTDAMVNLGYQYKKGEGVSKDLSEAIRWYRKAADAGNAKAMFNLGLACENGEGVPKDAGEATQWYRKAAKAGDVDAMWRLVDQFETALEHRAEALEKGRTDDGAKEGSDAITKDGKEALQLLRKAADHVDARAAAFLSEFNRRNDVVLKRFEVAEQQAKAAHQQALQHLKEDWDNCLILHDGRHVLVGKKPGEFLWWKSMSDTSLVKLTGVDSEEAERLLEERQQKHEQALQNIKKAWDNMLVLSDGRHVAVGKNDEFVAYKSMTDLSDPVKLTGAAKEEAKRLLEEYRQRR